MGRKEPGRRTTPRSPLRWRWPGGGGGRNGGGGPRASHRVWGGGEDGRRRMDRVSRDVAGVRGCYGCHEMVLMSGDLCCAMLWVSWDLMGIIGWDWC